MTQGWGTPLVRLEVCESTNDLARLLAASGLPEGTVVVARRQTRGRGRHGRMWASPEGGLWCSLLVRPAAARAAWGRLSLAIAVATAEAVEQASSIEATIRWPNDVLVHGRKVAGILLEAMPEAVIAGIGINANVSAEALPPELRDRAGSLEGLTGRAVSLEALLDALLARCAHWYACWRSVAQEDARQILAAWAARDAARGQRVVVEAGAERIEGIADGIDEQGALRVRTPAGAVRTVIAGHLAPALRLRLVSERSTPGGV